jgi:hypothetical protein
LVARFNGVEEVVGSNPAAPTNDDAALGSAAFLLNQETGMITEEKIARLRNIVSLLLFVLGALMSVVSLAAEFLGLDLTPGFGIVQMFQLLVGLTLLTAAGFLHVHGLRERDAPRSLQADIGVRLALTGLVFAYVAGLADLLGIGTHVDPRFDRPYVGWLQTMGIVIGIFSITSGLLLYYTSRGLRRNGGTSLMQSAFNKLQGEKEQAEE